MIHRAVLTCDLRTDCSYTPLSINHPDIMFRGLEHNGGKKVREALAARPEGQSIDLHPLSRVYHVATCCSGMQAHGIPPPPPPLRRCT